MTRIVCGVLAVVLSGCSSGPPQDAHKPPARQPSQSQAETPATAAADACAACLRARMVNNWCPNCKVGYVAGVRIESEYFFDFLDAHGHQVDLRTIDCPVCLKVVEVDGFCDKCRIGWVNRQAYFSRLTYHLGRAEPRPTKQLSCATCRKNAASCGWCEKCGVGMVGNFAIRNRAEHESAEREYRRLLAAVEKATRCDQCAVALFTGLPCRRCNRPPAGEAAPSTD